MRLLRCRETSHGGLRCVRFRWHRTWHYSNDDGANVSWSWYEDVEDGG